jgi:hypothetical protein
LIKSVGLAAHGKKLSRLREILFSDFSQTWLEKNQKFDFSFSFQNAPSLRFSFNDYGEKDVFYEKLKKIFALFPGQYDQKVFKAIMSLMGTKNAPHQTTFGFEWSRGASFPRLKIYFEELFNVYSAQKTRDLAKSLLESLSIEGKEVFLDKSDTIAALCVDFFPDGSIAFKNYTLYKNREEIGRAIKKTGRNFDHKIWSNVVATGGGEAFFYLTKRIAQSGRVESMKLYKIFEFSLLSKTINKRILAISSLLKKYKQNESFNAFGDYLNQKKVCSNPVILSADVDREKNVKIDYYLTLKI